jgi:Cys-tRNA(Pro) deacylase
MSEEKLAAVDELESMGISHRVFVHPGPVKSLDQAAEERKQSPDQVVRSLLFRLNEEDFAMVLVAGPGQIPWKRLRTHFGVRRLTMATSEEVSEITGYQIGAVSPFGLREYVPIYIDQTVFIQQEISLGSGRRGTAILLDSKDLLSALPRAIRTDFSS